MEVVGDRSYICHLLFLLEFFSAWRERPECLAQMAFQWSSAISGVVGNILPNEKTIILPALLACCMEDNRRLPPLDLDVWGFLPGPAAEDFFRVGSDRDIISSQPIRSWTRRPASQLYTYLLPIVLEVGFRLAGTEPKWGSIPLDRTPHLEWVLEIAFSSDDDEVIADAVCMFVMNGTPTLLDSFARYFAKRMERDTPFLPRLQRLAMHAIRCIWKSGPNESGLETIHLLNRFDVVGGNDWDVMLEGVIHSRAGLEGLSLRYWRLKLETACNGWRLEERDIGVMRSLREAGSWEKLEIWMLVVWTCLPRSDEAIHKSMEEIQEVTLKLLSRRPSALQRFEDSCKSGASDDSNDRMLRERLRDICDQVRAGTTPSDRFQTVLYAPFLYRPSFIQPNVSIFSANRTVLTRSSPRFSRGTTVSEGSFHISLIASR